jgi:hypothetical protein
MSDLKQGTKNDTGKPRFDLIPPDFMWLLAELFAMGAKKYADRNWEKGIKFGRVFGAMQRHAWRFWAGEEFDQEDGQRHLVSVAWCALVLLHYSLNDLKYKEFDDRVKGDVRPWASIVDDLDEIDQVLKDDNVEFSDKFTKVMELQNEKREASKAKGIIYHCSFPFCSNSVAPHLSGQLVFCQLHSDGGIHKTG